MQRSGELGYSDTKPLVAWKEQQSFPNGAVDPVSRRQEDRGEEQPNFQWMVQQLAHQLCSNFDGVTQMVQER